MNQRVMGKLNGKWNLFLFSIAATLAFGGNVDAKVSKQEWAIDKRVPGEAVAWRPKSGSIEGKEDYEVVGTVEAGPWVAVPVDDEDGFEAVPSDEIPTLARPDEFEKEKLPAVNVAALDPVSIDDPVEAAPSLNFNAMSGSGCALQAKGPVDRGFWFAAGLPLLLLLQKFLSSRRKNNNQNVA